MEKLKKIQEDYDNFKERADFCRDCGDVFRHSELKNGLCAEHHCELMDRHSGEDFQDVEHEEVEEEIDRPF